MSPNLVDRYTLAKKNYGVVGMRGAWEVDHSIPISKGGSNHLNNLFPACIPCNRKKGNSSNAVARKPHGLLVAPMSKKAKESKRKKSILTGLALGAGFGSAFGPVGMLLCGTIGAIAGDSNEQ
ncbi:HNH endonuclease [Catenovulum sp. 2E275]|uniref:HNH endonuclease n=1 Tax=Catenovulum sp. 2E275 TaxID=2980497 RepID=UPI0021D2A5EA|nr:HNH endonuclease signature motif containing protein [Catenovulum sp. 2E275]MCU4677647.1 HNH endonuclease [Catenovulum sp. 2E275]